MYGSRYTNNIIIEKVAPWNAAKYLNTFLAFDGLTYVSDAIGGLCIISTFP